MKEDNIENNDDEIVIEINSNEDIQKSGRRQTRIGNNKKSKKGKPKKKFTRKQKILIALGVVAVIIATIGIVFGVYIFKAGGNVKDAVLNMATDIVGDQDPIFVLVLGVSEDISAQLTDTIMLCGYNPKSQKAIMLSVPRDTFVGKSEATAGGYDKINAQIQTSADKTVEKVQLITGVTIDYYVIVRNISLTSIFETIGSVEFDVPINMDYDDPTQDLHIHLKKGKQTLEPDQIEQLLRFRHNNDGSSYPSSYGDNDYGRMRTQRDFIKAVMDQKVSLQNVGNLKDMASTVYTNLQTNMSGYTVLDYVPHALKFKTSDLRTEMLPGQSAMINNLWFYKTNFKQTRQLVNELMVYLELDDKTLESHYKYAKDIKGVKPDGNWVANEVTIDDDDVPTSTKKNSNTTNKNTTKDNDVKENCDHKYAIYSNTATCDKNGTVVYKCTKCDKEYSEKSNALGHTFKNGVCTREGCNAKDPSYTPKTENKVQNTIVAEDKKPPHTHAYTGEISRVEPTCGKPGSRVMKCSCGDTQTQQISATGKHTYGEWITKTPATETSAGLKERICTECGKTESESIPQLAPSKPEQPAPGGNEGEGGSEGSESGDGQTPSTGTVTLVS